jgi:hypothetical protein
MHERAPCRLSKLGGNKSSIRGQNNARWCQVCYILAPKAPKGVRSDQWKRARSEYTRVI